MAGHRDDDFRAWRFESCEERLALSAQPVADFWYDTTLEAAESLRAPAQEQALEIFGTPDAAVRQQYGLSGAGQTVVVIDSGIAYDHVALGGGFGSSYRVVGGWDFAENDANPYDDGPAGFHGTHVAGIVGASGSTSGVAPGVDLVALRVFNDQGGGYFSWVEQALSWVHQNRNAFDSPITTVNLSLGTEWNSTSLPHWATLEEELKQLADDGIFVSVAAGNSFQTYATAGLSYPAASPYVTAVASVDASGNLSRFSQRANGVLAATGERVTSTVPDAFYGGDGIKNDWGAASGTSMAAPQVAGASVLVREAMQKFGYTDITGASIRELLKTTADVGADPVTGVSFYRINVGRAIDSLTPPDPVAATNWGTVEQRRIDHLAFTGAETWFELTAARSGTLTVESLYSSTRGNIQTELYDAHQRPLATASAVTGGTRADMDVAAGQRVLVKITGANADVSFRLTNLLSRSGASATVAGTSATDVVSWQAASQALTINGVNYTLSGVSQLSLQGGSGSDRLSLTGSNSSETVSLAPQSGKMSGGGTTVTTTGFESTEFVGGKEDRAWLTDSAGNDVFEATPQWARLTGSGFSNLVTGAGGVGGTSQAGGSDLAKLFDSSGNDWLSARPGAATVEGAGFKLEASGFSQVLVLATGGGYDKAWLHDSWGADELDASSRFVWLRGAGYSLRAEGFENIVVAATAGSRDVARFWGSTGNDLLTVWGAQRNFYSGGVSIETSNIRQVSFDAGGGYDQIDYYSASSSGRLYGRSHYGTIVDQAFETYFSATESVTARVRQVHKLKTDLAAVEFYFQKIGRK